MKKRTKREAIQIENTADTTTTHESVLLLTQRTKTTRTKPTTTMTNIYYDEHSDSMGSLDTMYLMLQGAPLSPPAKFHHHVSHQPWKKYVHEIALPNCQSCDDETLPSSTDLFAQHGGGCSPACEFCGRPRARSPAKFCSKLPSLMEIDKRSSS
jgi:hypothetical protein